MRIFLVCLCLLTPFAALAQSDNSDRGFIQGILEDALSAPGRSVRIEGFSGALSSRATIDEITVTDPDGVWVTARGVALDWNRSALLRGQVIIEEISIEELLLPRKPLPAEGETPSPEASGAFSLPELPVSVDIAEMRIDRMVVGETVFGQAAEVMFTGSAKLAGGAGETALEIKRLDRDGSFTIAGAFDNESRALVLDLDLVEPADGIAANLLGLPGKPSVALSVKGDDPLSDFTATVLLATDGQERLTGEVSLLSDDDGTARFAADLGGDLAPILAPQYAEFLGDAVQLRAEGARAADGAFDLSQLQLKAAALSLDGAARVGADGWPETFALDAVIAPPESNTVVLPLPGAATSVEGVTLSASFNAAAGDVWAITGEARGFSQERLRIETVGFDGEGEISRENQSVTGALDLNSDGIAPVDAALAEAIGTALRGALKFGWAKGAPLRLREVDLSGADYGLTGMITVSGLEGETPITVTPDLVLSALDLTRFAEISGLALAGSAKLDVSGRAEPVTGVIDLKLDGSTRALGLGIAQVDPLLAGDGVLTLGITRDETGLTADPLLIRTDHARIEGIAQLRTGASTAEITASVPDLSRIAAGFDGAADVTATLVQVDETWTIEADASLPGATRATWRGTLRGNGTDALAVAGRLEAAVGQLAAFSAIAGRDLAGAVNLTVEGGADILAKTFDVTASGATQSPRFGVPLAEGFLQGRTSFDVAAAGAVGGQIDIRTAVIEGPQINAKLSGGFGPQTGDLAFDVTLADLGLALPELPGAANLTGTVVRREGVWAIDTDARLPGDTGASFVGTVAGDGTTALEIAGRLEAQVAQLSAFSPLAGRDLAGSAEVVIEGRGDVVAKSFDLIATGATQSPKFGVPMAEGLLRGRTSFDISAVGQIGSDITIRNALIDGQQLQATASGAFGPETGRLALDVAVVNLGVVLPGLPGPARLNGTADRQAGVWTVVADANLPGDTGASFRGTVAGDGATALDIDGRIEAQVARLSAFAPLAGRPLSGAVSLTAEGQIAVLDGAFDITASGSASNPGFGVPAIEPLLRGTSQFDLSIARAANGAISIRNVMLDASGIDANVSGSFGDNSGSVTYRVSLPNLGLVVPDLPGPASVSGTAQQQGDSWQINAAGTGPGGIELSVRGRAAQDGSRLDLTTSGLVPLALANRQLSGQALSGFVRFDLAVNGPPALSSVSGRLSLADARLALPAQGLSVDGISGQVDLAGAQARVAIGGTLSSGGQLRITGPVALAAPFNADLTAELINVTLRDESLYEVLLGGRITMTGPLTGGARIGGAINLETAEMRIPDLGPSYSALDGLRHINPPADVRQTLRYAGLEQVETRRGSGPSYPIDLVVNAPNRLFVRGRGLDAELGGRLRLTGTTTNIVPVGSFSLIRGRLDLLGRRLDVTQGEVILRGSFDPIIAFEATTQVDDVAITLRIEGLASAPELTVTSVPELPQEEALSLFLFGRDVTSISPFQAVQLAAAIRTLTGQGGLGLTGTLREGLGVDDLDIGTDAEGNTEARVGKYLSENIYTDVTVSSDGTSEINLNLDLTPDVTVRGRVGSDGDTGIGIFYERDY
ncbi:MULTISPECIES: translocation/assembly module TamB domain-containing protein [unclassified Marinovum]